VRVAGKSILITKKQEGVTKITKQKGNMALRADLHRGQRVAPELVLLRHDG
jgi:hypothetical protein